MSKPVNHEIILKVKFIVDGSIYHTRMYLDRGLIDVRNHVSLAALEFWLKHYGANERINNVVP